MTRRNLELVEPLRAGARGTTLLEAIDCTLTPMGAAPAPPVGALAPPRSGRHRRTARCGGGVHPRQPRTWPPPRGARRRARSRAARRPRGRRPRHAAGARGAPRFVRAPPRRARGARRPRRPGTERRARGGRGGAGPAERSHRRAAGPASPTARRRRLADGGAIRAGYDAELDELRDLRDGGKRYIAALQQRERERTGIPSLKVGFNKVFGYYLEITHAHASRVPPDYERRQTLAGAERYVTPELKSYEAKVLGAEERIAAREERALRRAPRGGGPGDRADPGHRGRVGAARRVERIGRDGGGAPLRPPVGELGVRALPPPMPPPRDRAAGAVASGSSPTTCALPMPSGSCSSPAPTWPASPPSCGRSVSWWCWPRWGASFRPRPRTSAWWTACSPASARATISPAASPPSWWR